MRSKYLALESAKLEDYSNCMGTNSRARGIGLSMGSDPELLYTFASFVPYRSRTQAGVSNEPYSTEFESSTAEHRFDYKGVSISTT